MRFLRGITPALRLSIVLTLMTTSVVFLAEPVGLMPDTTAERVDARLRLSEAIALQLSVASHEDGTDMLAAVSEMILERNPTVRSVGIRSTDGSVLFATEAHEATWGTTAIEASDSTRLQLPLYEGAVLWGSAELCFHPLQSALLPTSIALALFIPLVGFLLYWLYLRSVLKHLDPSAVIPDRVKAMLDTMSEGVVVLDKGESIILANDAFSEACGIPSERLTGRKASTIAWKNAEGTGKPEVYPWMAAADTGAPTTGVQLRLTHAKADDRIFVVNSTPIFGGAGDCRGALATFDDVTAIEARNTELQKTIQELRELRQEVQQQNDQLQVLAARDPLTDCLNRRSLFQQLDAEWPQNPSGQAFSCIMADIDHFKSINDTHGHSTGDDVLREVSALLRFGVGDDGIVGRYGGEEFCIIMPGADADEGLRMADRLRGAIAGASPAGLRVTCSLGVSSLEFGAHEPHDLIDQADQALYHAKESGRNRAERYDRIKDQKRPASAPTPRVIEEPESKESAAVTIPFHAVLALKSALAHRDASTAAHSERVAELCMATARGLMPPGDAFVLEVAALLHDIGKIGVPDSVLLKPGPLTADEWEIMERHDHAGTEIINAAFHCPELTNIVRNHHSRFDGNGDDGDSGLHGERIPLRARILCIADAYDAMVSDRVYRKGRSQEEAFTELRRCAGTQFDPDMVDRFIDAVSQMRTGAVCPASGSVDRVLELGLATERLTSALDDCDRAVLTAMAERLQRIALNNEWPEIAELAGELLEFSETEADLESILEATNGLLNLCHSTQRDFLDANEKARAARRQDVPTAAGEQNEAA